MLGKNEAQLPDHYDSSRGFRPRQDFAAFFPVASYHAWRADSVRISNFKSEISKYEDVPAVFNLLS